VTPKSSCLLRFIVLEESDNTFFETSAITNPKENLQKILVKCSKNKRLKMREMKMMVKKKRIFLDISSIFMKPVIYVCRFYSTFSTFFSTAFSSDIFLDRFIYKKIVMLKVIMVVIMIRNREKKQVICELELEKVMKSVYLQ
jgi:hypothetical protein